jgi:hypothetical protein
MSNGSAGPELTPVGDELQTPEAASELERAAAALETMTSEVQGLMAELKKESEEPLISLEAEKATTAAATLREVSERSASLAKALDAAKEPDMKKLAKEVGALVGLLKALMDKYPAPAAKSDDPPAASDDPPADPADPPADPAADPPADPPKPSYPFATVAEKSLGVAATLATAKELSDELRASIEGVVKSMGELAEALKVEKADVELELPAAFTAEAPVEADVVKAMEGILRDLSSRISSVAKMVTGEEISDAVKKEVGLLQAMLTKAHEGLPVKTCKASQELVETLKGVANKAVDLLKKAEESKLEDKELLEKAQEVGKSIEALVAKYGEIKTQDEFELSDLGQILNAQGFLTQFEAAMEKLAPPADPPPTDDPPPADGNVAELTEKITALGEQLQALQAQVAKARENTPPPASGGQDPDPGAGGGGGNNADIIFPLDYNDPEYHEKLKQRGIE